MPHTAKPVEQKQHGFSLIELLIALLIMSVGVLGMAGLQTLSMQQHRSALLQSDATMLINDMFDRMRSNPSVSYAGVAMSAPPALATSCIDHSCTPEEMKNFDIAEWQCLISSTNLSGGQYPACARLGVRGRLPGAPCATSGDTCTGGSITQVGDIYTLSVQWVDQQTLSQGAVGNRQVTLKMKAHYEG